MMDQLCRIHMPTEPTPAIYTKGDIIDVFLVWIESVAPDVAPPTCFPCFCVSLWPVSWCGMKERASFLPLQTKNGHVSALYLGSFPHLRGCYRSHGHGGSSASVDGTRLMKNSTKQARCTRKNENIEVLCTPSRIVFLLNELTDSSTQRIGKKRRREGIPPVALP